MAFDQKPTPFKRGQRLSAAALNELANSIPRQIMTGDGINVESFGQRQLIRLTNSNQVTLPDINNYIVELVVLAEFHDYLLCAPYEQPTAAGGDWTVTPHSDTRGADYPGLIYVAKPYHLQKTTWDGVALNGVTYIYSSVIGERTAGTYVEQITPSYIPGEIIYAVAGVTGFTNPDGEQILWQDINAASRIFVSRLTVEEEDGSPIVNDVKRILAGNGLIVTAGANPGEAIISIDTDSADVTYDNSEFTYDDSIINYNNTVINYGPSVTVNFANNVTNNVTNNKKVTYTGAGRVVFQTQLEICGWTFWCWEDHTFTPPVVDDWEPPGHHDDLEWGQLVVRVNCSNIWALTGITPEREDDGEIVGGQALILINVSNFNMKLMNENNGSEPANRFALPGGFNLIVQPNAGVILWYSVDSINPATGRWHALVEAGGITGEELPSWNDGFIRSVYYENGRVVEISGGAVEGGIGGSGEIGAGVGGGAAGFSAAVSASLGVVLDDATLAGTAVAAIPLVNVNASLSVVLDDATLSGTAAVAVPGTPPPCGSASWSFTFAGGTGGASVYNQSYTMLNSFGQFWYGTTGGVSASLDLSSSPYTLTITVPFSMVSAVYQVASWDCNGANVMTSTSYNGTGSVPVTLTLTTP